LSRSFHRRPNFLKPLELQIVMSTLFSFARGATALAIVAQVVTSALPLSTALAQSQGPFSTLEGSWAGDGMLTAGDGHSERLRCRAKYFVSPSGQNLDQQLRCASDSYHFDVNSGLVRDGDGISGTWTETNRNASGSVQARSEGDSIVARVAGPSFTASMTVTTNANRQRVQIIPNGADIKSVTIDMRRQ
jgi:hypothetical protein